MKKLFFILVFAFVACGPSGKSQSARSKAYCEQAEELKEANTRLQHYKYTICNLSDKIIGVKSPKLKNPATLQSQQCRGFDGDSFCIHNSCLDWPVQITDAKDRILGEYSFGNYVVVKERNQVKACKEVTRSAEAKKGRRGPAGFAL